jgi:hypothetical protein
MAGVFTPQQVARLAGVCDNGSYIGVVAQTGLSGGRTDVWQIYRVDAWWDTEDFDTLNHDGTTWFGLQFCTNSSGDWEGWRDHDDPSLIAEWTMQPATFTAIGGTLNQWLAPVTFYISTPYVELVASTRTANVPTGFRANVYYKRRTLDPIKAALIKAYGL